MANPVSWDLVSDLLVVVVFFRTLSARLSMEMATHMGMDWGWDLTPLPGIVHPAHQQTSVWLKDGTVSCACDLVAL